MRTAERKGIVSEIARWALAVTPGILDSRHRMMEEQTISRSERIARIITEVLSPPLVGIAVLGIITYAVTSSLEQFLVWWAISAGAIAIVPLAFVLWGVRRGRFTDHHITLREQRTLPFIVGLVSVCAAIAVMVVFHAPPDVLAITITTMIGGVVLMGLTRITKPSMHAATVAGSAVVMVIHFGLGPYTIPLFVLVPIVAWGRIKIKAHTLYHVVLGSLTGIALAIVLFGLGRSYFLG